MNTLAGLSILGCKIERHKHHVNILVYSRGSAREKQKPDEHSKIFQYLHFPRVLPILSILSTPLVLYSQSRLIQLDQHTQRDDISSLGGARDGIRKSSRSAYD